MRKIARYGWKPDLPGKDKRFEPTEHAKSPIVNWRDKLPPCYDQGNLGSCTANALCGATQFLQAIEGKPSVMPSRLFLYYNERVIEGTRMEDAGAQIRDGLLSMVTDGLCPESQWPYQDDLAFDKPSPDCYAVAQQAEIEDYLRVDNTNIEDLLAAIALGPVVGGFTVYESFESGAVARTGVVPMPGKNEAIVGGHAILVTGYNADSQLFTVRNSWGPKWGQNGYFTMPFDYFTDGDLADDFWLLKRIT